MAKINTTNYQPVTAWDGTQDLFVVEQPDGTKVATPEQVKQYVEAGDFEATGEVKDGHGNILKDMAESANFIGQKDVWFPDLYDFNTKIKTLTAEDCATYIQKIGNMTIAFLYFTNGSALGSFNTMMQFRNFPNGCNWCLGGSVYNSKFENEPRDIQASYVGVYFRPNITGSLNNGVFSMVLFFANL